MLRNEKDGKVIMMNDLQQTIRNVILSMERPFNLSDLFYTLRENYEIRNRVLVLWVLDELCENGMINYSEVNNDCWAFEVIRPV